MIARLRELLDVARALVRRPAAPMIYVSDPTLRDAMASMARRPVDPMSAFERVRERSTWQLTPEQRERFVAEMERRNAQAIAIEPALSPGLAPCPTCATPQQPRDGHMAVHFAHALDQRPCVGSWPARKVAA